MRAQPAPELHAGLGLNTALYYPQYLQRHGGATSGHLVWAGRDCVRLRLLVRLLLDVRGGGEGVVRWAYVEVAVEVAVESSVRGRVTDSWSRPWNRPWNRPWKHP